MRRPLLGEPLALDLVNTSWVDHGKGVDYFDEQQHVRQWLAEHGLPGGDDAERVRERLIVVRRALRVALEEKNHDPLNAALGHGARRPWFRDGRPSEELVLDTQDWWAAWLAAADYARVMSERPERVRACANPECVLWFLDTSKNGSRRWCSMELCGNRVKVGRFNQRRRESSG